VCKVRNKQKQINKMKKNEQKQLFEQKIDLIQVDSVIGSGYETKVAELALLDGYYFKDR
jgi:hypothetical protein